MINKNLKVQEVFVFKREKGASVSVQGRRRWSMKLTFCGRVGM